MIKETTKKIHFIAYSPKKGRIEDTAPAPTVTVNRKVNRISFSKATVLETGMNGKFLRLYYEPIKKVIGWQIRDKVDHAEMKQWKLVKALAGGGWGMNIKKMLDAFDGRLSKEVYEKIPVQKYREINALSEYKNEVFYFVELNDNPEELRKGMGNITVGESVTA